MRNWMPYPDLGAQAQDGRSRNNLSGKGEQENERKMWKKVNSRNLTCSDSYCDNQAWPDYLQQ